MRLYFDFFTAKSGQVTRIEANLVTLLQKVTRMSDEMNALNAAMDRMSAVVDNIAVELQELTTALAKALQQGNTADIQTVTQRLQELTNKLVTAGTTADITPETPVEPAPAAPPAEPAPGEVVPL